MPDAISDRPSISRADPRGRVTPGFDIVFFRHFTAGLLALASLDLACRDHRADVSATLTATAFNRSSLRWLGISA
jgi:hypothetical protein